MERGRLIGSHLIKVGLYFQSLKLFDQHGPFIIDTRIAPSGNFYVNYSRSSHQFKSFCRSGASYGIAFVLICGNYPSLVSRKS